MTDPNDHDDEIEIEIDDRAPRTDRDDDESVTSESNGESATSESNSESAKGQIDGDGADEQSAEPLRSTGPTRPRPDDELFGPTPERRLEAELGQIDLRSTPDGYVEAQVTGLEAIDETTVELTVRLPEDSMASFRLEKPVPWSDEFLFTRIVEDIGYDASSVSHIVGETVYLTRADLEEPDAENWWDASVHAANRYLESSLGRRFRLDDDSGPTWRLVDPLERPDPEPEQLSPATKRTLAAGAVLLGSIVAVLGAIVATTGTVVASSGTIAATLPGLALVVLGIVALVKKTKPQGA